MPKVIAIEGFYLRCLPIKSFNMSQIDFIEKESAEASEIHH